MITVESTGGPVNVLVVGVGGQGVIMVSKVLAQLGQDRGFMVKQSEVHGMAKRGGSVFSHVRFGREVWSPTIPRGQAHVLLAMEWAEGLRWLPHLAPGAGVFIADTRRIVPPFAFRNRRRGATAAYVHTEPDDLRRQTPNAIALDASRIAEDAGNARAANTVLLGALSTVFDFPEESWLSVIARFVPAKTAAANAEAFHRGRSWAELTPPTTCGAVDANGTIRIRAGTGAAAAAADAPAAEVDWLFNGRWCKGCGICVQVCPERCLVQAGNKLPRMERSEDCTGCRLCEFLCPDFAISVAPAAAPEAPVQ